MRAHTLPMPGTMAGALSVRPEGPGVEMESESWVKGQARVVPTYSDEQRAAFRRTEERIAQIRPVVTAG